MVDQPIDFVTPVPEGACLRCGHWRVEHGLDERDTSCTECRCVEFKEAKPQP